MSLQVNLSSPDIKSAYDAVLAGSQDYFLLTYEKGTNDLKVQEVEKGSLEDALFEFSSGRIQYGFVRVIDPNSQLPKFILINWCGEGVPETRKGIFASHSASVGQYLKNYHVSINARREDDLDAKSIMRKVTDSSGSKYAAAGQSANTQSGGRIEAVGSTYKPIGAPDIAALRAGAKKDVIQPVGTAYTSARDELSNIRSTPSNTSSVPDAPRPVAQPAAPAPPPAPAAPVSSQPLPRAPTVGGIVGSVSQPPPVAPPAPAPAPVSAPAKPAEDDRIRPVGTAYEPVKLGKPGKLGNRFPFGGVQESTPAPAPAPRASGGLTWTQRQEKAKKEREEEEERARTAAVKAAGVGVGAGTVVAGAAGIGAVAARDDEASEIPAPPPPPPAPVAPRTEDDGISAVTDSLQRTKLDEGTAEALAKPSGAKDQLRAVAVYEYVAGEDNEISFAEGDTITGIQQVDEGWWSGITPSGQEGLFPATYVELIEEAAQEPEPETDIPPPPPPPPPAPAPASVAAPVSAEDDVPPPPPPPPPPPAGGSGSAVHAPIAPPAPPPPAAAAAEEESAEHYCIAQYDYEAAEDNELAFNEGDKIVNIEFASEDWWSGTHEMTGLTGLFPAVSRRTEKM